MNYPVLCHGAGCQQLAKYKIAACWSHGLTSELKTYGLACEHCLPELFKASIKRQLTARTLPGELAEKPGIYELHGGWRDRDLIRLPDLEASITSTGQD